jgi:hypothetical protein
MERGRRTAERGRRRSEEFFGQRKEVDGWSEEFVGSPEEVVARPVEVEEGPTRSLRGPKRSLHGGKAFPRGPHPRPLSAAHPAPRERGARIQAAVLPSSAASCWERRRPAGSNQGREGAPSPAQRGRVGEGVFPRYHISRSCSKNGSSPVSPSWLWSLWVLWRPGGGLGCSTLPVPIPARSGDSGTSCRSSSGSSEGLLFWCVGFAQHRLRSPRPPYRPPSKRSTSTSRPPKLKASFGSSA